MYMMLNWRLGRLESKERVGCFSLLSEVCDQKMKMNRSCNCQKFQGVRGDRRLNADRRRRRERLYSQEEKRVQRDAGNCDLSPRRQWRDFVMIRNGGMNVCART